MSHCPGDQRSLLRVIRQQARPGNGGTAHPFQERNVKTDRVIQISFRSTNESCANRAEPRIGADFGDEGDRRGKGVCRIDWKGRRLPVLGARHRRNRALAGRWKHALGRNFAFAYRVVFMRA